MEVLQRFNDLSAFMKNVCQLVTLFTCNDVGIVERR